MVQPMSLYFFGAVMFLAGIIGTGLPRLGFFLLAVAGGLILMGAR